MPNPTQPMNEEELLDKIADLVADGDQPGIVDLILADRNAAIREARIDEATMFPGRMQHILETEYNEELNTDMTGHGALDIAKFARDDRVKTLQSQPNAKEEE